MEPGKTPMAAALKYLSRRPQTEQKIVGRLSTAGFKDDDIAESISRLKGWGYLDDREYGINRIRKLQERLKSRSYIKLDLENNGISPSLASELLDLYYPEQMEIEIARELIQKKRSSGKFDVRKLYSGLLRDGFSENTVHLCFPSVDPT